MALFHKLRENTGIRYLIVGGSAFVLEYSSFILLFKVAGFQLYLANSLSFGIGLLTSFLLNRLWTFSGATYARKSHHQFLMYLILAFINLFITNIIIGSLLNYFGLNPSIGKIVAILSIVIWNFLIFKFIIFSNVTNKKLD